MIPTFSWQSITENTGDNHLDFSVNINPLGIPDSVKAQLANLADIAGVYPDPNCNYLSSCLSEKYHVSPNHILCGNGADDLLYRLVFATNPKHAIVVEPTFEEYNRALELVGCEIHHYTVREENHFLLDKEVLSAIKADSDMMFLCNPNNPTGQLVNPLLLQEIIERCQDNHILLVVDECFMEFLPSWKEYTVKEIAALSKNLIVIDAFTKTYSLAGFRLGFCISGNTNLLSGMRLYGQDFAVSTPAQLAGICALMDRSYMQGTYHILSSERKWLLSELQKFPLKVYPSQSNFLLFQTADKHIRQKLFEKGIKVRDCSRFYGLGPEYCRIAVRTHNENIALIKILKQIYANEVGT
ncbi:MAG: aminotransferase class I/II-fold pyridoxal phosphate-dependent enzyme [Lachnospiraceae bacterium]|jgi:threonine-phosphate decarboxylase|nr:aminotransferase class I/II-fold pyridoxal phosphate-dependent enzyme [Lachnospiraceae bacterium]